MQEINTPKYVIHAVNKTKGKKLIDPVIQSYFCLGEKQSFEKDIGSLNKCHSARMTQLDAQLNGGGNKFFFHKASFDAIETLHL